MVTNSHGKRMTEVSKFMEKCELTAGDDTHRRKLKNAISSYEIAVSSTQSKVFSNWENARNIAAQIKDYSLAHLAELLELFEQRIGSRGAEVVWAEDAAEALQFIGSIVKEEGVARAVKSKTMTTEEVGLNEFLEANEVEIWETDLGELIVQLAGEKPYHIVTPAMHKTKEDVADLFHEQLGIPKTDNPEDLTKAARDYLRDVFLTADIGFSGANFIIAEEGAIVITENEGNALLTTSCPKIHVVIVGIEKILPRLSDLSLFLPLLATSGTGQNMTAYNSIIRGPRQKNESDGPERMVVILLDNGRSSLLGKPHVNTALRCIRCGACLNSCPVFKTIGGHAYGTTYQGPIGSAITPYFKGLKQWNHLAYASSLCGACSQVCPVKIDIHRLLLDVRRNTTESGGLEKKWVWVIRLWYHIMAKRKRVDLWRRIYRYFRVPLSLVLWPNNERELPKVSQHSFSELWAEYGKSRENTE